MVLVDALCAVYNISRLLAHVLATVGYITCGKLSFTSGSSIVCIPRLTWTLDLASLSQQGRFKIAHNASFVHPNDTPSHSPDPVLVTDILDCAMLSKGLSLRDLARVHAQRLAQLDRPLDGLHEKIALGECGLFWLLMRDKERGDDDVVPVKRVRQWLCEERLPDDWWTSTRPALPVGLSQARSSANMVQQLMTSA
ncbi:hypothetical protein APHAL10511_002449 [Amanita phalloides]|nr:hypothetical protein APHAL10511_002449 [Amanita phalloides]